MPNVKGKYLAARPRTINFKQGRKAGESRESFQIAFIPRSDPHGFPTVMTTDEETFEALGTLESGQAIEVKYIETALDEKIAVGVMVAGA